MAFLHFKPFRHPHPVTLATSGNIVAQIWQELVMQRYLKDRSVKNRVSPLIDQARTYFTDATNSNWKSAGLLYYYSFLNLSKAYLAERKKITYKALKTTSIYHGLAADPQVISNIGDFKLSIFPTKPVDTRNIFSCLYGEVVGDKWPFKNKIAVTIKDVASHCIDISSELQSLYLVKHALISIQSLIRTHSGKAWFEMAVPLDSLDIVKQHVPSYFVKTKELKEMTQIDKENWHQAYQRTAYSLKHHVLMCGPEFSIEDNGMNTAMYTAKEHVGDYAISPAYEDPNNTWHFSPRVALHGKRLKWHPLLSDYLFAFALSSILRYQPHMLSSGGRDYFLAEAWCAQSPIAVIRYFLMQLTNPPVHVVPR